MKKCCHCKKDLSSVCFQKNKSAPDGLQYRCKECTRIANKACRAKRGHLWKEKLDPWKKRPENRERSNASVRRRRRLLDPKKRHDDQLRWALKSKYGLTPELKQILIDCQGGICFICQVPIDIYCATDHSHEIDTIRGMLCKKCNSGLGFFNDSADLLKRAAQYLDEANIELNKEVTTEDFKIATQILKEIHGNTKETRSISLSGDSQASSWEIACGTPCSGG